MKMIDIGANLTNKRFKNDLPEVIDRSQAQGVEHIVVTGTSFEASKQAIALADQYPGYLSATAGVHPHDANTWGEQSSSSLELLARHKSVVAIGECGLDYNRNFSPKDKQLECFEAQLALAVALKLPVFLHERDAHDDFFRVLKRYRADLKAAVVHCFTGNRVEVEAYLDLDCHIGITGWLCDERRGHDLREAVPHIPVNRLMIETDAPFLTPRDIRPKPKNNRNEPAILSHVLASLAALIDMDVQMLADKTYLTTREFFALDN